MKTIILFLACWAIAYCTQHNVDKETKCIPGCKCTYATTYELKISRCSKNISLGKTTFVNPEMRPISTLEITGAVIDKVDKNAFNSLRNLQTISFKNTKFNKLDLDVSFLPSLKVLSFRGCSFSDIPVFDSATLQELVFSNCNLTDVWKKFGKLKSLEFLDLSNNFIKQVDKDTFSQLKSLSTLNLSKNNLTMLPPDAFRNNAQLNTLYLDNNPLKFFSLNEDLPLELLSLRSCELTTFDHSITRYLISLSTLNLSNNKIASFHKETLQGLFDLKYLDISNNRLKHLDADVFIDNVRLHNIILDKNHFRTLPSFNTPPGDTFSTHLFQCKDCQLDYISDNAFQNMPSIQILDLSDNKLTNITNFLKPIKGLVMLNLEGNNISEISPFAFTENTNLKKIILIGNPLLSVSPKLFTNNTVLTALDLSKTNLEQIWSNSQTILETLERLMLSSGNLKTIRLEDLKVTPNLKELDIEDNPLKCSKELHDALMWLVEKRVSRIIANTDELNDYFGGKYIESWSNLAKEVCPKDHSFLFKIQDAEEEIDDEDDMDDEDYDDPVSVRTEVSNKLPRVTDAEVYEDVYSNYEENYQDELLEKDISNKVPKIIDTELPGFNNEDEINDIDAFSINDDFKDIDERYRLPKVGFFEEPESRMGLLSKTSHIILLSAVFILTALLVVVSTVCITLVVLKKNRYMHIKSANLPRFKIPLWSTVPVLKKHSGSVYQTLTEDNSGTMTPKVTRHEYLFKSTPAVHTSLNP